ncbi:Polyporopepsin [Trametes pubescens]|uniref:Polyporopepsin n=1 Tax=Trametes pubescens TaxID=154538 RepID=A0A1M2VW84_TRAPU|nr:Polyporopepsin [Trametes pubescens]
MSRGFSSSFFSLLLLALSVAVTAGATPVVQVRDNLVRLPFAKRLNFTGSGKLIERDQARVRNLRARANAKLSGLTLTNDAVISVPVDNQVVDYVANVQVGTPPTTYSLLIDTGSSNTWVGAGKSFVQTSSSRQTADRVSVTYGSGDFSGTEFTDNVSLGSGLNIKGQSIGVASESDGFDGVDGILGIGPVDLTVATLSPDTRSTIPTVTDNLFSQGVITQNLVAVSFAPSQKTDNVNGELTFGGTDSSKFTGSINFAPLTRTSPASEFWGINQAIRFGTNTNILSNTAGIVDTGTTLTLIATDALTRYQRATGAVFDNATGLLRITPAQFAKLQSLFFTINGVNFEFTANAQIFPRALNTAIGGNANSVYLIVGDIGTNSGEGLDFINGQTWLERFYAVFDTANRRVGIANTPFTTATSN